MPPRALAPQPNEELDPSARLQDVREAGHGEIHGGEHLDRFLHESPRVDDRTAGAMLAFFLVHRPFYLASLIMMSGARSTRSHSATVTEKRRHPNELAVPNATPSGATIVR